MFNVMRIMKNNIHNVGNYGEVCIPFLTFKCIHYIKCLHVGVINKKNNFYCNLYIFINEIYIYLSEFIFVVILKIIEKLQKK